MVLKEILLLVFLIISKSVPLTYGFSSGMFQFHQQLHTQSITILHYADPTILYSLTSVMIPTFFSYYSNYSLEQLKDKNKLTINVEVKYVYSYRLVVSYIYMDSMPNLQVAFFNLTGKSPESSYQSKKNIHFNNETNIAAHLVGFSFSNSTQYIYFHPDETKTIYRLYLYTNASIDDDQWIAVNLIILQTNFDYNSTLCIGSYINSQSQVSSKRSPLKLQVQVQLHYIVGLQAFYLKTANFVFNKSINVITMDGPGTYSFSIIVINNTCNYIFDYQAYQQKRQQTMYLVLMIVFIVIFIVLAFSMIFYFINHRKKRQQNKVRIEEQDNKKQNISNNNNKRSQDCQQSGSSSSSDRLSKSNNGSSQSIQNNNKSKSEQQHLDDNVPVSNVRLNNSRISGKKPPKSN